MITLQNVILRRGSNILLQDVNWTIFHKQRVGIIGENGTGKSSLFAMLLGQLEPDSGDLELPRQLKMSHVAQETPAYSKSALDYVLDGDEELRGLEQQLIQAEQKDDGHLIAKLHARLSEIDAYTAPARAAQLLDGLGFSNQEQQKSVSDFSGGWRVRLNLAKALMCRSDILLLDEPTNHLDLDAVIWLQNWLVKYPGTLLLISHDRDFLDEVVDHIAHLSHQHLKVYSGNYSAFEKLRANEILLQQAAYEKQQKHIAHLQSFINRFKAKASKAKQAQSRMKALDKLELVSAVHTESPFQFHFKETGPCPNPLLTLNNATIAYGDKIVLTGLNFSVTPKDRIGLIGPNGAGKSSLIKLLAEELKAKEGACIFSAGVKIGYFAQHQVDHLDLDETPLTHLKRIAGQQTEQQLRTFLGSFGFPGQRVLEPVKIFSGGEKSRLALALIVWQQPNLLLLDEPTNHLDLEMRHALSMALQEYQGAMILVSHDRFLVRTTVDQLLLVANGKVENFSGDLSEYEEWLFEFRRQNDKNATQPAKPDVSRKQQRQLDAKERELRRPLVSKIKKLEEELTKLEKKLANIESILSSTEIYEDKNKEQLQKHLLEQANLNKQLKEVEQEWLEASEKLDSMNNE